MTEHKNGLQHIFLPNSHELLDVHTPTSITVFLQEDAPACVGVGAGTAAEQLSGAFASKAIPFVPVRGCHDHRAGHSSR